MKKMDDFTDFDVVSRIISMLKDMDKEIQVHILTTVITWLKIDMNNLQHSFLPIQHRQSNRIKENKNISIPKFTNNVEMTPKQFMLEKQPRTDVERLACLAYYLTHYRDTPHFKTIDLSKLNTEAAQRKFANAAETAKNAVKMLYLVPAPKKGYRQLSADGEQVVAALPDREAAATIKKRMRPRKTRKPGNRKKEEVAGK